MNHLSISRGVLDKPANAFLMLRVAWLGWLVALVALFAYPVAILEMPDVHELVVIAYGSAGMCARDDCAPESWLVTHTDWTWFDLTDTWHLWLPLLWAMIIPTLIHVRRRNRLGPAFNDWPKARSADDPQSYRATAERSLRGYERPFATYVRAFWGRMSMGMVFCALPFYGLFHTRLIKNYGCVFYSPVCSILEYFVYAGLMLAVILLHAPSVRRVFGRSAKEYGIWRRDGAVWHEERQRRPRLSS
ncbi:MAG TPA: hypothetical protein PKA58_20695 [Polyangium sp.]|nr:hypothetical protein [Polyangium sp.]